MKPNGNRERVSSILQSDKESTLLALADQLEMEPATFYKHVEQLRRTNPNIRLPKRTLNVNKVGTTAYWIYELREYFLDNNGFYPTQPWLGKQVDVSRQRVKQIVDTFEIVEPVKPVKLFNGIVLEPGIAQEIKDISEELGVSVQIALRAWTFRLAKYRNKILDDTPP